MGDWSVPYSDDEDAGQGFYEPYDPNVIITLYEVLQKGEIPQFRAPIFPREKPESEEMEEKSLELMDTKEQTPDKQTPEVTEFDFDTQPEDNVKRFTPRRTPNRPETKKVAKLSKVFSDIMKYKKLDDEQRQEEQPQAN